MSCIVDRCHYRPCLVPAKQNGICKDMSKSLFSHLYMNGCNKKRSPHRACTVREPDGICTILHQDCTRCTPSCTQAALQATRMHPNAQKTHPNAPNAPKGCPPSPPHSTGPPYIQLLPGLNFSLSPACPPIKIIKS